jgi:phosphate starvation-inducible protein PhoH
MKAKKVSELVYVRSTIQSEDGETGFLSGDLAEKMQFFNVPLQDKLEELLTKPEIQSLVKDERIQQYPTSFLRGYNFAAKAVLFDEAQNATFDSIVTVSTRMAAFSKLFLVGDSRGQNDYGSKSGFKKFCEAFNDQEAADNGIVYFKFGSEDIMRSGVVKFIVQRLEERAKKNDGDHYRPSGL